MDSRRGFTTLLVYCYNMTISVLLPLPWEEEEYLSITDSRMSTIVRVSCFLAFMGIIHIYNILQAKSVMERTQKDRCCYDRPPTRMSRPRKSLSACTLFNKTRPQKLCHLRKPQYSAPENPQYFSFETEVSFQNGSFDCQRVTPRISIEETDSQTSFPSFHRHYLKYQTKCQDGPTPSIDSDTSQNSKSNLKICQFREDGGSFSFSDLDPVQEDLEIAEDLESDIRDSLTVNHDTLRQ